MAPSSSAPPTSSPEPSSRKRSRAIDDPDFNKRKKGNQPHPLKVSGRHAGRVGHHFEPYAPVLGLGAETEPAQVKNLDPNELQLYRLYEMLVNIAPDLEKLIADADDDAEAIQSAAKHLSEGREQARTDDTSTLKERIIDILRLVLGDAAIHGLDRKSKLERGHNHLTTGDLLCPIDKDYNDAKVREALQNCTMEDATALEYCNFMYEGNKGDPAKLLVGFLMSEILIRCFLCIFISPSAALSPDLAGNRSSKPGKGKKL